MVMTKFNPTITANLVPHITKGYDNKSFAMDDIHNYIFLMSQNKMAVVLWELWGIGI